jgi:hypothetical protein
VALTIAADPGADHAIIADVSGSSGAIVCNPAPRAHAAPASASGGQRDSRAAAPLRI